MGTHAHTPHQALTKTATAWWSDQWYLFPYFPSFKNYFCFLWQVSWNPKLTHQGFYTFVSGRQIYNPFSTVYFSWNQGRPRIKVLMHCSPLHQVPSALHWIHKLTADSRAWSGVYVCIYIYIYIYSYIHVYNSITLLYTRNEHNIVNQRYFHLKIPG